MLTLTYTYDYVSELYIKILPGDNKLAIQLFLIRMLIYNHFITKLHKKQPCYNPEQHMHTTPCKYVRNAISVYRFD